ncbi:hypothetical protein LY28_01321 [Ruminiclostridium sufflavum DSM 19573]|uniref:Uncharacterized protein n=1 Tax=Ruminiclostridium sufflavum DSM 19573 TaxID=1121337 RepID=A0A318XR38_9FIRM|nr:hypothetical protein [Ruminiclostridium sufflavum]PYG88472.1 hypothetical protein LY28_01321 [Ruminiclostridium sufflavum DSM 19573]
MKKYSGKQLFNITSNNEKLKIDIKIKDLAWLIEKSPNNYDEYYVKRGKRKEFIDYIGNALADMSDPDTGDSPVMTMFENIFEEIFSSGEDFIKSSSMKDRQSVN